MRKVKQKEWNKRKASHREAFLNIGFIDGEKENDSAE